MDSKTDHVMHVWINREANWDGKGKPAEMPIDPHKNGLYNFKSAIQLLSYLPTQIGKERRKELPLVHQQCSHSAPEQMAENYLMCWFGKRLSECPILARLQAAFDEERTRTMPSGRDSYYASITEEQIDEAKAMTCVWHLLMGNEGQHVDWNEGAIQDVSDRKFWSRVYDNLNAANQMEEPDECED